MNTALAPPREGEVSGREWLSYLHPVTSKSDSAYPHSLRDLPTLNFGVGEENQKIHEEKVGDLSVLVISHLFSSKECAHLIKITTDLGYESVAWEYSPKYRNCTRVVCKSEQLSNIIWKRLTTVLKREHLADVRPYGFGNEGIWRPLGVNSCVRFAQYPPGGVFRKHRDGSFVLNDEERSIYTVLVYLNNDYKEGETVFYHREKSFTLTPRTGQCVLFTHDVQHEGKAVAKGNKFILRTDLMFQRLDDAPVQVRSYTKDPKYVEACRLYQLSIDLQKQGKPHQSTEAYLQAMELQAQLASQPAPLGSESRLLPAEIWSLILRRTSLRCIAQFARVSRAFRRISRSALLWRSLYADRWPLSAQVMETATNIAPTSLVQIFSRKKPGAESSASSSSSVTSTDWYVAYKHRYVADHRFQVLYVDLDHDYLRAGMLGEEEKILEPAVYSQVSGHYWSAGSGMLETLVGTAAQFDNWRDETPVALGSMTSDSKAIQIFLRWCFLEGWRKQRKCAQDHPVLFVRPMHWSDQDCAMFGDKLYEHLKVPLLGFVNRSLMTTYAYQLRTALVVRCGAAGEWSVVPVIDGVVYEKHGKFLRSSDVATNLPSSFAPSSGLNEEEEHAFIRPDEKTVCEAALRHFLTDHKIHEAIKNVLSECVSFEQGKAAELLLRYSVILDGAWADVVREPLLKLLEGATVRFLPRLPMPDQQIQLQRWNETVSLVPPQHRGQSVAFEGLAKFAQHAEIRRFFGVPDAPLLDSDERLVIWIAERRNHHDAKWEWRAVQERELGDCWESGLSKEPRRGKPDRVSIKCFKDVAAMATWASYNMPLLRQLASSNRLRVLRMLYGEWEKAKREAANAFWVSETEGLLAWRKTNHLLQCPLLFCSVFSTGLFGELHLMKYANASELVWINGSSWISDFICADLAKMTSYNKKTK